MIGRKIGQYRVEGVLGRGGMGVVYRGVHESLGRPVAIKALVPELTRQPEFRDRFFAEAKTQAKLQHPNVVTVYDLLEEGGEYFIVMELAQGVPLDDRLRAAAGRGMGLEESVTICRQVLEALDHAHSEGVIHRDVKPSNVLIDADGRIKLMDFGIALLVGDKRLTASQSAIGTPVYMSPEQILRPREVDHRTDIYSAGILLFEMLAGRPPFDDETEYGIKKLHVEAEPPDLGTLRAGLPGELKRIVATALAKDPEDRFPSAGVFERALRGDTPVAAPPTARPAAPRATRLQSAVPAEAVSTRRPASAPALVLATVVACGGLGWTWWPRAAEIVPEISHATEVPPKPITLAVRDPRALDPTTPFLALDGIVPPSPEEEENPEDTEQSVTTPRPRIRPRPKPAPAASTTPPISVPEELTRVPATMLTASPAIGARAPVDSVDGDGAVEDFTELGRLIDELETLSKKTFRTHKDLGGEGPLLEALDRFKDSARDTRKEFRKATGTGVRGAWHRLQKRDGDLEAFEARARELLRQVRRIDALLRAEPPGTAVEVSWNETLGNVEELRARL